MKRIIYLCEILIYAFCVTLTALHWYYLYQYDYYKGAVFHIAAFIAYGAVTIFCIVSMFSKYEPVPKKLKQWTLILFGGCMLLMVAFVLSFTEFSFSIVFSVVALALFFVSARNIRGKAFLKLIITFIILTAFLFVAAFLLRFAEATPINISELTDSEIKAYHLKIFLKSVGGAATYCYIPIIITFRFADHLTDDIILENID